MESIMQPANKISFSEGEMQSLKTEHISKRYGKKQVNTDITLTFGRGFHGIIGPNGSGKSTYLNTLCGIVVPDSGEIFFNGEKVTGMPKSYRGVLRVLFQHPPVFESHTVYEMMEYGAMLYEVDAKDKKRQISAALSEVHLTGEEKKKVKTLSGGMRQRLCIAMALLGQSEIILLDEPTAGLDISERESLKQILTKLKRDRIIIMTTHILTDLSEIADTLTILKSGRVCAREELYDLEPEYRTESYLYGIYEKGLL